MNSASLITVPQIRVFVSSPGDVNDERKIALEVIEQLPYRPSFREKVMFRVIAWDKPGAGTVMRATLTPQDAINKGLPTPAECDIVVVLFWSRMGTPFTDQDGKAYQSGTHWELMNALEAKRPETIIYRRMDKPPFDVTDADFDAKHAQYKAVQAFFASDVFYGVGTDGQRIIRRGVNDYTTPDDFRRLFETALEELTLEILSKSGGNPDPQPDLKDSENVTTLRTVAWDTNRSPFPGLRSFDEADEDIFFGRGYETDALIRQLQNSRFVAVAGASGSGKSSLVAAGLLPRLRANAIVGSKDWHFVRLTPGTQPLEQLYDALLKAVPKLKPNPLEARRIRQNFLADMREAPEAFADICAAGLEGEPEWAEVLLFVDQFEELFTLTSKEDAQAFVVLLDVAARSNRVRVVVTLRADFYHRAVEYPQLAERLRAGSFPLAIPKRDALRQMIERPAERAGLVFDENLVVRILDDTGDEPGNLALMAYALDELYQLDDDRRLTHAEYEALGGVQGAIGTRAEHIFAGLNMDEKVIQQIFHALVEVDERGTATRQRATMQIEGLTEDERRLLEAFVTGRLLTASAEPGGTAVVEVAHEAILRSWPRLAEWIEDTQDDLRLLRQLRSAAALWVANQRSRDFLWLGDRGRDAQAMIGRLHPNLNDLEQAFARPEAEHLLDELTDTHTVHPRRSEISTRLHQLEHRLQGAGVGKDSVPEMAWLAVNGSEGKKHRFEFGEFEVRPFCIAQYLVTYEQYQAFVAAEDGFDKSVWWDKMPEKYQKQELEKQQQPYINYPRDSVSWYQAVAFARWMNQRLQGLALPHPGGMLRVGENAEVRLPTEGEWQWAAQGGVEKRQYPWGDWQEGYANTSEAGLNRTTAVGMYPQGAAVCRALDMAGNLMEWCQNDKNKPEIVDRYGGENKVLRGGSIANNRHEAAASRHTTYPLHRTDYDFGLRLVVGRPL